MPSCRYTLKRVRRTDPLYQEMKDCFQHLKRFYSRDARGRKAAFSDPLPKHLPALYLFKPLEPMPGWSGGFHFSDKHRRDAIALHFNNPSHIMTGCLYHEMVHFLHQDLHGVSLPSFTLLLITLFLVLGLMWFVPFVSWFLAVSLLPVCIAFRLYPRLKDPSSLNLRYNCYVRLLCYIFHANPKICPYRWQW